MGFARQRPRTQPCDEHLPPLRGDFVRVLTPTENNRVNELIGFVGVTIAILIALALLSYSPHDPSFNVSADSPDIHAARNWIGPVGAYGADMFFQGFGYAAFLLPVGIFLVGYRWFRSEAVDSPTIKLVGYTMLVLMVPTLLTLWHMPEVRGAIPPGGLLGHVASAGLHAAFNTVGANLVGLAIFFIGLFLTTKFSFIETHEWLRGPLSKLNVIGPLRERYWAWREEREQERMRKRLEQIKMEGRAPIPSQGASQGDTNVADEEEQRESRMEESERSRAIVFGGPEQKKAAAKSSPSPRIAKGATSFRLPSPDLLRMAERSERIDEDDLKDCARAIEQKCQEFDIGGRGDQRKPVPGGTPNQTKT